MKKNKFIILILITILFTLTNNSLADENNSLNILFTHDIHDHIEDFNIIQNKEIVNIGGFERLNNKIQEELRKDKESLILDGGDYSMGTLFQTIYGTDNPSLRLLGEIGYEATTIGNHEFDFRAKGLADSLYSAKKSGDRLPEILISNIDFNNYENVNKDDVDQLKKSFEEYGVKDYLILNKKNYKIGIFGVIGNEAISNAPMAGVNFEDPIESAKRITKTLKEDEEVDLIICLSHSGTWEDKKKSEDEIMAKEVKDIDIIISGHTHTELFDPIIVGNTIIASSGCYSKHLGKLEIKREKDNWELEDYKLEPLTDNVESNNLSSNIQFFKNKVQENYLSHFNMEFNEVLANNKISFISEDELGKEHKEEPLANLITDSYIHVIKEIEGDNYERIAASIVPYGTIRGSLTKGNILVSDIFNISSLGIGPDEISGYPLIDVYLTGKELKTTAEVDASIQPIMDVAQLYMSGMNYSFNPNRLIFNKVTDIYLVNEDGSREEINNEELYRVVTGLYTAQMLSIVKDQSFGLMSIVPKDSSGNEITDFEKHIIYDGDKEVKEWYALAKYIQSFDKKDGIAEIPDYYSQAQGRKTIEKNKNILSLISNPNKIAMGFYGIILIILILLIFTIRFVVKKIRKNKR